MNITLLAKWLPSINTSSQETKAQGKKIAQYLGINEKEYRKMLSKLREEIDIVERKMSRNEWEQIHYEAVPSRAMAIYREAFEKKDGERYTEFISDVETGEKKINASTLYPYDILERYGLDISWDYNGYMGLDEELDRVLEAQWKALPNYIEGEHNILVMADTSGSMSGRPLVTSVGLAIYFAERNKGYFNNTFMTFSEDPKFVTLKGETLYDKVKTIETINANTDIERAFKKILETAVENNVPAEDMPETLIIISDMEFDMQVRGGGDHNTYYETFESMYEEAGYKIPTIVFWDVEARNDVFHAVSDKKGVQMVSGSSTSTFKNIINNIGKTPYESMLEVLKAYSHIKIK